MTADIKDILAELDNKITDIGDLDLVEEITDIYTDLVNHIDESSKQFWELVKKLAMLEKERDDLLAKLKIENKNEQDAEFEDAEQI